MHRELAAAHHQEEGATDRAEQERVLAEIEDLTAQAFDQDAVAAQEEAIPAATARGDGAGREDGAGQEDSAGQKGRAARHRAAAARSRAAALRARARALASDSPQDAERESRLAEANDEHALAEEQLAEGATDGAGHAVRSAVRNMHRAWAQLHQARGRLSEAGARGQADLTAGRESDAALEQALAAEAEVSAAEQRENARREDPEQEPSSEAGRQRAEHLEQVRQDERIRARLERQRRDQHGLRRFRPGPGRTLGGSPAISAGRLRLRGGLLRCRDAAGRRPGARFARAAPSRSRDDRRAGHPPVPQQTAADAGPAARDHVPGVRDPGGDVRERGGVRADGLDPYRVAGQQQSRSYRAAVPAGVRGGRADRGAVRCPVPHPLHPAAGHRRPGHAHRRRGAADRPEPGERQRGRARGREFGADRAGRRRLGVTGAVHHRVLAALGADSARLRAGRAAARGHRIPGRAGLAVPGHRHRDQPAGGDPRLGLDLPGHRRWRCAAGHAPVRARQRPAADAGPGAMGRRRTRVDVPAAARPAEADINPRGTCPPTERGRHRRALRTGPAVKGLLLLSQSFRSARAWFAGRRAEL